MLGLAMPQLRVLPNPNGVPGDGLDENNDRIHWTYLYRGIEPSGLGSGAGNTENYFFRHRRGLGG